jgi:hypothetical protein
MAHLRSSPECLHEKRVEQEEVVDSIEIRDDRPLTKQLRAAARSGKGTFLLMTFKEVFDNIAAGERAGYPCSPWLAVGRPAVWPASIVSPYATSGRPPADGLSTRLRACLFRRGRPARGLQRRPVLQGRGGTRLQAGRAVAGGAGAGGVGAAAARLPNWKLR